MTDTPTPTGTPPVVPAATPKPRTATKPKTATKAVRAKPLKAAATKRAPTRKPAAAKTTTANVKAAANKASAKVRSEAATLKGQATDKARSYAEQGKGKATDALDGLSKMINEAAGQVDDRLGSQYGDYARSAASAVAGLASSIKSKDVDDLVNDARDLVRKSPVVTVGVAAAIGFAFVRLIKSGTADAATPKSKPRAKRPAAKKSS